MFIFGVSISWNPPVSSTLCNMSYPTTVGHQDLMPWSWNMPTCWSSDLKILETETNTIQAWWVLIKLDGSRSNKHSGFFQLLLTIHPCISMYGIFTYLYGLYHKKKIDLTKGKYTSPMVMVYLPRFTIKKIQTNRR